MNESTLDRELVRSFAEKAGIEINLAVQLLKVNGFLNKNQTLISEQHIDALLVLSNKYDLNPLTGEISVVPENDGSVYPVFGVDGWNRIANRHPQFDGVEFRYSEETIKPSGSEISCPVWIEAIVYRKDRSRPTIVREYLDENYQAPLGDSDDDYWQKAPKRCLRHRAQSQGYRIAFGLVGVDMGRASTDKSVPRAPTVDETSIQDTSELSASAKDKIDEVIINLTARAETSGFAACFDFVEERFSGQEKVYAVNQLKKSKELSERSTDNEVDQQLDSPTSNEAENQEQEVPMTSHVDEVVSTKSIEPTRRRGRKKKSQL